MKNNKPQPTYAKLHNKAVRLYRKTAIFLLWAGVISILATVIGIFRSQAGYGMSLAINVYINRLIATISLPDYAYFLIIFAISIATGALLAVLGFFAQQGKKTFLFVGAALYLADFAVVFLVYGANWDTTYAFTIATHLVILGALLIAIYEYFNVIAIEKRFHGQTATNLHETDGTEE
ncbi:MAG: hypothetical protein WCX85_00765 [Bacilli bacterium]|jgi:hypothetical protein